MQPPGVFISYSHDSDEHRDRVFGLSERLRKDGIETILDLYVPNGLPLEGWPRWMLNSLDGATHVLCVCTETYYRRFRGHEDPEKGKGVDWEGAYITQELYDQRHVSRKFIPILFDKEDSKYIPEPLRGAAYFLLRSLEAYQSLYDALLDQGAVDPQPVGQARRKNRLKGKATEFEPMVDLPDAHGPANPAKSGKRMSLRIVLISLILAIIGIGLIVWLVVVYWPRTPVNSGEVGTPGGIDLDSTDLPALEEESAVEEDTEESAAKGLALLQKPEPYDPNFLSKRIPLPQVTDKMSAGDLLNGEVFDYAHYSLVMNERTGMPLFAACNIDRETRVIVPRLRDQWLLDPRIPADLQKGEAVYKWNEWDRGHLVPRSAISWGGEASAKTAALSAFFYSNATPQHQNFNQGIWFRLEEFVLEGLQPNAARLSVFCGPVHQSIDLMYRGTPIPQRVWKIVALDNPGSSPEVLVYAFIMTQYDIVSPHEFVPVDRSHGRINPRDYQVTVPDVESQTPLDFGVMKQFDVGTNGNFE